MQTILTVRTSAQRLQFFRRLVPPSDDPSMRRVSHASEGPDNMRARIKAALNAVSLSRPAGRIHTSGTSGTI